MALLKRGSKGPKVVDLQDMLNQARSKPKLVTDGKFGPKTEASVAFFQAKKSLDVDGLAGPKTLSALKRATGGPKGGGGDGDLVKRFRTLHEKLRRQSIKDANRMFIAREGIESAPASCRKIGTEHFLAMIPKLEKSIARAARIAEKHAAFAKLLAEDGKLFEKEVASDPAKAKKRFAVVENKEKQFAELVVEFDAASSDWIRLRGEIRDELRRRKKDPKRPEPSGGDPKLQRAFTKLHEKLHKELKTNAHLMFITLESLKGAPGSCRRIGTEHFTDMIPALERMLKKGAAVAKKNSRFLKLLDEDAELFEKELASDPEKARKRLLVVRNKEKQIDELDSEFAAVTGEFGDMQEEIRRELKKARAAR